MLYDAKCCLEAVVSFTAAKLADTLALSKSQEGNKVNHTCMFGCMTWPSSPNPQTPNQTQIADGKRGFKQKKAEITCLLELLNTKP